MSEIMKERKEEGGKEQGMRWVKKSVEEEEKRTEIEG